MNVSVPLLCIALFIFLSPFQALAQDSYCVEDDVGPWDFVCVYSMENHWGSMTAAEEACESINEWVSDIAIDFWTQLSFVDCEWASSGGCHKTDHGCTS